MVTSKSKSANYCTEISNDNTLVFSDVAEDKGGNGKYFRPHDLLCAGFASCLNITIRMILENKNIEYESVQVEVDLDRKTEDVTKFLYNIEITASISEELKEQLITMAINCPVRKTLSKNIEFVRI